jgi:hypothetical protein
MLEADGNQWELNAPYGGHVGATCAIWEQCVCHMGVVCTSYGAVWEPCAHVAAIWCQVGGGWCHMGAVCNM